MARLFPSGYIILYSNQQYFRVPISSHFGECRLLSIFLIISLLVVMKWYLITVMICISPLTVQSDPFKTCQVIPLLCWEHCWLPISHRVRANILIVAHKFLHGVLFSFPVQPLTSSAVTFLFAFSSPASLASLLFI